MDRIINIESELKRLSTVKERTRKEVLRLEGILEFYNKLIENDVTYLKVPMSESDREVYQKMIEDDDI
jgi:hydroxymethylglutaryl-CoA reductase